MELHLPEPPLIETYIKSCRPSLSFSAFHIHTTSAMLTEQILSSLPFVGGKKTITPNHPLGPLTAGEISESAKIIKSIWPENTNIQFKAITLQEPNKADLVPFLAAERARKSTPTIERRSFVVYYLRNTVSNSISSGVNADGLEQTP